MELAYRECWIRLNNQHLWVLMYGDPGSVDEGVETAGGRILVFHQRETLRRFALKLGATVKESRVIVDFDAAQRVLGEPSVAECMGARAMWELVDVLQSAVGLPPLALSEAEERVYAKLFEGSEQPVVSTIAPKPIRLDGWERNVVLRIAKEGESLLDQGHWV